MPVTLYLPNEPPTTVAMEVTVTSLLAMGYARVPSEVAALLGCTHNLVDVLACEPGYVVYSIFDHEGEPNIEGMRVLSLLTGIAFDSANEDELIRGPILIVT